MSFRLSCPHTSPQNGKAERKIRTINNITRTLLAHASLPPSFWNHALQMATYLLHVLPSKILGNLSPLEILYQQVPSYFHIRVFGCLCYPLIPSTTIHKLQPRSTPCVFLGYPSNHHGYKCYDLSSNKIIICRHVLFDEHVFPFARLQTPSPSTYDFLFDGLSPYSIYHLQNQSDPVSTQSQHNQTQNPSPVSHPQGPEHGSPHHSPPGSPLLSNQSSPTILSPTTSPYPSSSPPSIVQTSKSAPSLIKQPTMVTRSQMGVFKPNKKYSDHAYITKVTRSPLPRNPGNALRDPNWKMAMDDEYNCLCPDFTGVRT